MSRVRTADHILFDECIDAFRRERENYIPFISGPSKSFLLTSFMVNQKWDLGDCVVYPSKRIDLPGPYSAFICEVDNPEWVEADNPHLFGIALSAIISFIALKPCKSTRGGRLCKRKQLSKEDLHQLALFNPILTAGNGSEQTSLSKEKEDAICKEVKYVIDLLNKIDYKRYRIVMQSVRMVHLSLINKRDDFGLAYLLVVSSIESVAQKAIKLDKVNQKNPSEKMWQDKAKHDGLFAELFKAYKDARGKNKYLKDRYIKFILDYAPVTKWEEYIPHPMQDWAESIKKADPSHDINYIVGKKWFEKYPNDLLPHEIKNILSDSYSHRSNFIHQGEQPPHTPNSYDRFFQEYLVYNNSKIEEKILLNYQSLVGISKYSLINWLKL